MFINLKIFIRLVFKFMVFLFRIKFTTNVFSKSTFKNNLYCYCFYFRYKSQPVLKKRNITVKYFNTNVRFDPYGSYIFLHYLYRKPRGKCFILVFCKYLLYMLHFCTGDCFTAVLQDYELQE